jgi:protein transport protein SEC24
MRQLTFSLKQVCVLRRVNTKAVAQASNSSLKEVRDQLTDKCCAILGAYRKHCASVSSTGQLILPESFKLYPVYTLALLKNMAFRGGANMSTDTRVYYMRMLSGMSVSDSIGLFYPRMMSLHDMDLGGEAGRFSDELGRVVFPGFIRASYERLDVDGVYLFGMHYVSITW